MSKKFVNWKSGRFKISPNEIGSFGERIVESLLRKEGFKVKPFDELLYRKRGCSKIEALVEICRENCEFEPKPCLRATQNIACMQSNWKRCHYYLSKYCQRVCRRFCKNRKILKILEEVKNEEDESRAGLDFMAYKDKKIWVVEVKTGTHSELKKSQRQFAERIEREMGIKLLHFHVCLDDEFDYSIRLRGDIDY